MALLEISALSAPSAYDDESGIGVFLGLRYEIVAIERRIRFHQSAIQVVGRPRVAFAFVSEVVIRLFELFVALDTRLTQP